MMRAPDQQHALTERYRDRVEVGEAVEDAGAIAPDQAGAHLFRIKKSHRGIAQRTCLRRLVAEAVDQDFLDEIGSLTGLVELDLRWPFTAADLAPLAGLAALEVLHIDAPTKVTDFSPLYGLKKLRVLTVEMPKKMPDLEWVRPLLGQLQVIGVEGSISTNYSVPSLDPLAGGAFEAFFCTSLTVRDKSLAALHACPNLKLLSGGVLAPFSEYAALRAARPEIVSQWFDPARWATNWRGGPSEGERAAGH